MVKKLKLPPSEQPLVHTSDCISHFISVFLQPLLFSISLSVFLDALPPVTGLSVTDSTENSVLLGWSPVTGATGYILRWTEEEGNYSESLGPGGVWFKDQKRNCS